MAQASGAVPLTIANNRRLAADIVLRGFYDSGVAGILSNANTAGYKKGSALPTILGGIIGGINR